MDAPTEEARLATLRDILEVQSAQSARLPSLRVDTSWMKRMWEQFKSLVEPWLPNFSIDPENFTFPVSGDIAWLAFKVLVLLCALILVAKILGWLFWRSRSRSRSPLANATPPPSIKNILSQACERGDWPLALRLRWSLFLTRTQRSTSLTLSEFAQQGGALSALYPVLGGMFAGRAHETLYEAFDQECAALEEHGKT